MPSTYRIVVHLLLLTAITASLVRSASSADKVDIATQQQADEAWQAQQAQRPLAERPFELKGDRLGMSLTAFKRKYHRELGPHKPPAPHASDDRPDKDNPMLFYKADMAHAGIVAAATTYPHEAFNSPPIRPTIAGIEADSYIYKFLDGKLYEISIAFDQRNFNRVKAALDAKYPTATSQPSPISRQILDLTADGQSIIWSNQVSSIMLCQHAGDRNSSLLLATHKQLAAEAEKRLSKLRASQDMPNPQ